MKVEQPGCINEGTARGSDDVTNEIVDLREEFAAVETRSRATIVIIHARRDVESISTHRTRTSHNSCVIVLQVSGFPGPRSARSLSQGILEPYSAAHNLRELACYCQVGQLVVNWGEAVYCIEVPTGLLDVDPRSLNT